jgi:hypothetical protein
MAMVWKPRSCSKKYACNNTRIVGCVIFYAVCIASKEINQGNLGFESSSTYRFNREGISSYPPHLKT